MSKTTQPIEALLFDVFGTVVDWRSSIAAAVTGFNAVHRTALEPYVVADRWRALYKPAMAPIIAGERPFVVLEALQKENLVTVLAEQGLTDVADPMLDELNARWRELMPWGDSIPGLTRLKRKYIIAPLSNGNVAMMVALAKWAGLPWDTVLGAELAYNYKPAPQVYLMAARLLELDTSQCLMVAAHNTDLVAAQALGFKTAFIARPTEYGPDQRTDLRPEHDYDYVADSLTSLAQMLGCGDDEPG